MPQTAPAPAPDHAAQEHIGFADLGLTAPLARAAAAAGWLQPTPVQRLVVPAVLQGRDVLVQAPTGTGKTASFVLPLLQLMQLQPGLEQQRPRRLFALVLAPTRELAAQIGAAAQALAPQVKTVVAVGGLSINPQLMALRGGTHLLVATPGRLLDLVQHRALHLPDLQVLVLDEADRLLDAGFADEMRRVLALIGLPSPQKGSGMSPWGRPGGLMPRRCQTLMFSATWSAAARELARSAQTDALELSVGPAALTAEEPAEEPADTSAAIEQRAIVVHTANRTPLLRHLIRTHRWPRVLVFVATQHASEHVADKLRQAGVPAAALHGQQSAGRRSQGLADLASGHLQVLVATDLAARGLHVPALDAVVNFDLPRAAADHTHRIGRTGRAGARGVALSFVLADAPGSEAHFRLIEKRQQQRVPRETVPGFEPPTVLPALPADPSGGVKGRRPSKKDKLRAAAARGSEV
jgi:superfamily II DNA/RNA helicase